MGVGCGLGSLAYLLQLVVPEKLRAPVVEIHVEGAVGRVSPPLCDRSLLATPVRRMMVRPDSHPLDDPRLFGKHVGSSFSFRSLADDAGDNLAQRTMAKAAAFPSASLTSERIRILHEYSWRGAPGGGRRTRIL